MFRKTRPLAHASFTPPRPAKGKAVKRYRYAELMTPYEKLKSRVDAESFLKPGITFEQLDKDSTVMMDDEAAALFSSQCKKIFKHSKTTGLAA